MNRRGSAASMAFRVVLLVAASLARIGCAGAQQAPDIAELVLDNGLKVVIVPDHRAPVVIHMLWYRIGSADSPAGRTGMAHFLEHLMFKGTTHHKKGEFTAAVAEVGGRENAFTSPDFTVFFQKVPPSALEEMMAFEADRMHNLSVSDAVVEAERKVIVNERATQVENNPSSLLRERMNEVLFPDYSYRNPVIGSRYDIENLKFSEIGAFYAAYYRPDNATLIVAGDVEPGAVRRLAERIYGPLPRGTQLPRPERRLEEKAPTTRTVTIEDPRLSVPSFRRTWIVPSYLRGGEHHAGHALELLAELLGGGSQSRLYRELVVNRRIARDVSVKFDGFGLHHGFFSVYGTPMAAGQLEAMEQAVGAEIAKIARDGVPPAELAAVRERYLRRTIFERDDLMERARVYGTALSIGLGVEDLHDEPRRIEAIGSDDLRHAAQAWLGADRSVTGYLRPARPTAEEGRP